ncbi:hypothetical protein C5N14_24780 [Micromonospora sp. MW-13]|nr:hypothetical protein C5N14_24780 [Micromonospora sp. MW-13]
MSYPTQLHRHRKAYQPLSGTHARALDLLIEALPPDFAIALGEARRPLHSGRPLIVCWSPARHAGRDAGTRQVLSVVAEIVAVFRTAQ